MNLFFDTSALVKFFHDEEGIQAVTELINSDENEIWLLELAGLEFLSALYRRFRNKEIDEEELEPATSSFEEQLDSFNIQPIGNAIIEEAKILLQKYGKTMGLRTLDAFHAGAFSLICDEKWIFVSSDSNLCTIMENMDLKTLNPLFS